MCPNIFSLNDTWLYIHYIKRKAGQKKLYKEEIYNFHASNNITGMSNYKDD